jgi:hypothetical protein
MTEASCCGASVISSRGTAGNEDSNDGVVVVVFVVVVVEKDEKSCGGTRSVVDCTGDGDGEDNVALAIGAGWR